MTYNHFDSYPAGLGEVVAKFVRTGTQGSLSKLAGKVVLIDQSVPPTPEQVAMCKAAGTVDLAVSEQKETDWYCLLRKAQGEPKGLRKLPFMIDSHEFLAESLFCEYAYIINLDSGFLEVYRGFNRDPKAAGRYAPIVTPGRDGKPDEYVGVALVGEISLDAIRSLKNVGAAVTAMDKMTDGDHDKTKKVKRVTEFDPEFCKEAKKDPCEVIASKLVE